MQKDHLIPEGVYAASLTPMHSDFSCNNKALADHCKDLIQRGCKGVILFGTTGEGTLFSVDERVNALNNVIQLGLDPKRVILGVTCLSVGDAVKLISEAIENSCLGVLVSPPFYYKNVDEAGVITFYREIIKKIAPKKIKILLYHIPQHTGVPITSAIITALIKEFPQYIVGIKDSGGNFSFTQEILRSFPDFGVFVGNETHLSEAVQQSASGAIAGIVNAYPELICSLYEYGKNSNKTNNNELAKKLVQGIRQYPIFSAIKAIVAHQKGNEWHTMRPPLMPLTQEQRDLLVKRQADFLDLLRI